MPGATLTASPTFPAGTVVSVYDADDFDRNGIAAEEITSATTAADGTTTFTGLTYGARYVAASTGGALRFSMGPDPASGPASEGDIIALDARLDAVESGGVALPFVAGHAYKQGQVATALGQTWTRNTDGTAGASFDVGEQVHWTLLPSSVATQNQGVDLTARAKLNASGQGIRAVDNGSGPNSVNALVLNEKLHLEYVSIDSGIPLSGSTDISPLLIEAGRLVGLANPGPRAIIQVPSGVFPCAPFVMPYSATFKGVDSTRPNLTVLSFLGLMDTAALGGDCAIEHVGSDGGWFDMSIRNAVPTTGIFQVAAPPEIYGTGVRLHGSGRCGNLEVLGFCYSVDLRSDHPIVEGTLVGSGWCSLYFGPGDFTQGDGEIGRIISGPPNWCGIAVSPSNLIGGVTFAAGTHFAGTYRGFLKLAASRRLPNYTTGTVNIANGSTTVTAGTGTTPAWKTNVKNGSLLVLSGVTVPYKVRRVISDTQLELCAAFPSATVTNKGYSLRDGLIGTGNFMLGCVLEDLAFEGVQGSHFECEDEIGLMSSNTFINVIAAGSKTAAEARAAIICSTLSDNVMINSSILSPGSGQWSEAAIIAQVFDRNDLGEVSYWVDSNIDSRGNGGNGVPLLRKNTVGALGAPAGSQARQRGSRCVIGRARAPVMRGDLLIDGGSAGSSADIQGAEVKPHNLRRRQVVGVALSHAQKTNEEGLLIQRGAGSGADVNVAPSGLVTVAAAIGDTTITVGSTTNLGAISAAVGPLVDYLGVTRATNAVIASTTTITVDALSVAIPRGVQFWLPRTTGSCLTLAGMPARPRWGAPQGGTAVTDAGQAVQAVNWRVDINSGYWLTATVYAVGDGCWDAGIAYRCIVARTAANVTAPASDATGWVKYEPAPENIVGDISSGAAGSGIDNGRKGGLILNRG